MVTLNDIQAAALRIRRDAIRTPVLRSAWVEEQLGGEVHFKCENLQRIGAFKFRGAANAVSAALERGDVGAAGVATHSSGNHGRALAEAARLHGIPCTVVMPSNAPKVKIQGVEEAGGRIVFCQPTLASREATLDQEISRSGAKLIHPYNDADVIAGQGTATLELLEQAPELDVIIAPIGGGGLLSGTSIAAKALRPGIRVLGAEPRNADDAARSLRSGRIEPLSSEHTLADGLRTQVGALTFPILQRFVDDIVTVSEQEMIEAMRMLWERLKIVIEPSCAVPFAALLNGSVDGRGARVGIILTGGNVDLDALPWIATGRS